MDLNKIMDLSKVSVEEIEKLGKGNPFLETALLHLFKETLALMITSGLPWSAKEFPEVLRIVANVMEIINSETK